MEKDGKSRAWRTEKKQKKMRQRYRKQGYDGYYLDGCTMAKQMMGSENRRIRKIAERETKISVMVEYDTYD